MRTTDSCFFLPFRLRSFHDKLRVLSFPLVLSGLYYCQPYGFSLLVLSSSSCFYGFCRRCLVWTCLQCRFLSWAAPCGDGEFSLEDCRQRGFFPLPKFCFVFVLLLSLFVPFLGRIVMEKIRNSAVVFFLSVDFFFSLNPAKHRSVPQLLKKEKKSIGAAPARRLRKHSHEMRGKLAVRRPTGPQRGVARRGAGGVAGAPPRRGGGVAGEGAVGAGCGGDPARAAAAGGARGAGVGRGARCCGGRPGPLESSSSAHVDPAAPGCRRTVRASSTACRHLSCGECFAAGDADAAMACPVQLPCSGTRVGNEHEALPISKIGLQHSDARGRQMSNNLIYTQTRQDAASQWCDAEKGSAVAPCKEGSWVATTMMEVQPAAGQPRQRWR